MTGAPDITDLVVVPIQSLLLEVQIIAGGRGREVGVFKDLRDSYKDTLISGQNRKKLLSDDYVADASAYNRSFPCMKATLMP